MIYLLIAYIYFTTIFWTIAFVTESMIWKNQPDIKMYEKVSLILFGSVVYPFLVPLLILFENLKKFLQRRRN